MCLILMMRKRIWLKRYQLARLGIRLLNRPSGGISVYTVFESSYVVDVSAKKNLDPMLLDLKD